MAINQTLLNELGNLANQVYEETKLGANTHQRVGQAFQDTHDLFADMESEGFIPTVNVKELDSLLTLTDLESKEGNVARYAVMAEAPNGTNYACIGVLENFIDPNVSSSPNVDPTHTYTQVFFTNLLLVNGGFDISNCDSDNLYVYTRSLTSDKSSDTGWRLVTSSNTEVLSVEGEYLNNKIEGISPRLILPLATILEESVTIQSVFSEQSAGDVVWCAANGAFAARDNATSPASYYAGWNAQGVYPASSLYVPEIQSGLNRDVWYYVQDEGAFYYWNGNAMTKITTIHFATQEDVAKKQDILTAGDGITIEDNVISANIPYDENAVAYGVRRSIYDSSGELERIGNMDFHRTLPVQSAMRGCLLNLDGTVNQYLPDTTWEGATLNGDAGHVMVEIPMHYRKCQLLDDGTMEIWLSYYPIQGYELIPKMFVGAYEATIQRSVNRLCSVMNDTEDYRGGNNNADYDGTYRSFLGVPASSVSMNNFRNYARNNGDAGLNGCGWNCYLYEAHKAITWFFVVEYATLNSQKAYNEELTDEGYHQGGLSTGITALNSSRFSNYWGASNTYYPFLKCGHTNEFGNHTGVKVITMPFEYNACTTTSGDYGTHYVGVYDETRGYVTGEYTSEGENLYQCIADADAGVPLSDTTYFSQVTRTTASVVRYRGIEEPFGHIYKGVCDMLCVAHANEENGGDGLNYYYVCKDPSKFTGSSIADYTFIGTSPGYATGSSTIYPTEMILGSSAEIIGKNQGGSSSTYYFDGLYVNNNVTSDTIRANFIGGYSALGAHAGLFFSRVVNAPSGTNTNYGSRLCFLP